MDVRPPKTEINLLLTTVMIGLINRDHIPIQIFVLVALGSRLYFSSIVIIFPKGERATLSMTALVIGLIKINHIPPAGWHNPTDNIFQKETKESEKTLTWANNHQV